VLPIVVGVLAIVAIVALLLLVRGGSDGNDVSVAGGPRTTPLQSGDPVPDFSAPGMTGGQVAWSDYQGRPAMLVVWAPWCPHCQAELPVLGRVAQQFPDVDVVTVETAVGQRTGPSGEGFFIEHGLSFPSAVDDGTRIMQALGVSAFPAIYAVGSDGRVITSAVGELPRSELVDMFRMLADQRS
jgi:peroxiredoxin